ncbi:membrane protein [Intrasporangium oryzae NRRL B-24470]|uniref:Membrane protein n=1 Tax=Intrasporangium oryzae NRRL B-24470 TaxID=1386089 RepID=W9GFI8_9MICO|nr:MFS transporter [Intrasporangium oryzae]EWT03578.1 membrane protein [Intrasporangium oryzae NRRL B-24470]
MRERLTRLLPPSPLARRLSAQSILFAIGEGLFLTGNAVFFTHVVGLTAAQVGLGLTIAGVMTFCFAVPLGRLADRLGAKRVWAVGAGVEAAVYLLYPAIHGFVAYVAVITAIELVGAAAGAGRGAYTLDVFSREERVRSLAFMRSALNIGFTVGALIGGLALATNRDDVIRAAPLLTAAILGVNALLISRLPDAVAGGDGVAALEEVEAVATPGAAEVIGDEHREGHGERLGTTEDDVTGQRAGALRNVGYLGMKVCQGVLGTNQVLLNVVIPLWLVQETDAPRVLLAWLFGTNTVLAVLLQVSAARGADTVPGALRASRISSAFFVLSCLIVAVTHDTVGWVTVVLVWVGHVTVTGAELFQSAADWGLTAELSDPDRRGEYQGAGRLGHTVGGVWAPAAYTFLAMEWGAVGWTVIAAIVVAAVVALPPAARMAQRHLEGQLAVAPAASVAVQS